MIYKIEVDWNDRLIADINKFSHLIFIVSSQLPKIANEWPLKWKKIKCNKKKQREALQMKMVVCCVCSCMLCAIYYVWNGKLSILYSPVTKSVSWTFADICKKFALHNTHQTPWWTGQLPCIYVHLFIINSCCCWVFFTFKWKQTESLMVSIESFKTEIHWCRMNGRNKMDKAERQTITHKNKFVNLLVR